ncbi:MAG: hypothetical protein WAO95_00925 [Burkholderiales bacterium]
MSERHSRRLQRGYLLEIPILLVVVAMGTSFLFPHLSPVGRKILIAIAAFPVLFCLYYMIVIPGWQPSSRGRLKPPWSMLAFLLLAAMIVVGVVSFVLG